MESWSPPEQAASSAGPDRFPTAGVNSLASVWVRAGARFIDTVLLAIPVALALTISVAASGTESTEEVTIPVWTIATWFGLTFLYETIGTTLWGQTIGKLICGVRVARIDNGRCPLWWQAGIRVAIPGVVGSVAHPLASFVVMGLYVAAAFDALRRTVPDRAAGTVVVRSR